MRRESKRKYNDAPHGEDGVYLIVNGLINILYLISTAVAMNGHIANGTMYLLNKISTTEVPLTPSLASDSGRILSST